jgi:hypothetical protein
VRRWQDLAAPDDPGSWYDLDYLMPTSRGSYMTVPPGGNGTSVTATGGGTVRYAFVADTLSSYVEWIFGASKIWLWDDFSGTVSDKTNGCTIGTYPHVAQFGNVTIAAMGAANPTIASTSGGNFAAIAGAPNAEIVVTHGGFVLLFNTSVNIDGWSSSDLYDHTNFATGEASSGRLVTTPGPILAACSFGDWVYVFKARGIYRMRYTGGYPFKWMNEVVDPNIGIGPNLGTSITGWFKYALAASATNLLFISPGDSAHSRMAVRMLDGIGQNRVVNPLTSVTNNNYLIQYRSSSESFFLWGLGSDMHSYVYCQPSEMWGKVSAPYNASALAVPMPVVGQRVSSYYSYPLGVGYYQSATNTLTRYAFGGSTYDASICYAETAKVGRADAKTYFERLTPLTRNRTAYTGATAALSISTFHELDATSAVATTAASESTARERFDFRVTDNFARFKVTWTAIDVEVLDFMLPGVKGAGKE